MPGDKKVIVVMPAYKAERTLRKTLDDLPREGIDEILLVDDASPDNTAALARQLGLHTIVHTENRGYGANQKTCYDAARARGADVVVLLHPDYQYEPKMATALVAPILAGEADFTFGSRFMRSWRDPFRGKMPLYRWVGNRLTTSIENLVMGTNFAELHSGYKAYSRRFLEAMPYHEFSDKFVFDSQMVIMAAISRRFVIREVPIPTRYAEDSSSVNIPNLLRYVSETVWYLLKAFRHRRQIRHRIQSRFAQLPSTQSMTPIEVAGHEGVVVGSGLAGGALEDLAKAIGAGQRTNGEGGGSGTVLSDPARAGTGDSDVSLSGALRRGADGDAE